MNARRSWLITSAHDRAGAQRAVAGEADVVVLDLEYTVAPKHKEAARAGLKELLQSLGPQPREIFVRVDRDTRWADARAGVLRGVKGLLLPCPESADEVTEIDALVGSLERQRGLELGSTELVLVLESAPGFWNIEALAQASPRITTLAVGRVDLSMHLGPVPQDEFRLFRYLMTRTLVAARTFGKKPLGAHWRPGSRGGAADAAHTARAAREAKCMGFEGCVCVAAEQVAAVNAGFTVAG